MRLTAKRVILELMSAAGGRAAPVAAAVEACRIFGITENSTRVTIARLLASGSLEAAGRGEYKLGARAEALSRELMSWRDLERRVRAWSGGWIAVHTGALGRTDRAALRVRSRALRLLGFRELARGLEVRPDNLEGGFVAARERLLKLGLDRDAVVASTKLDAEADARAMRLWDGRALTSQYKRMRARLDRWLDQEPGLDREVAARESFLLGGEAVKQILFDPYLPDPLVDVAARRALLDSAKRFDVVGRRIWERLFGVPHGIAASGVLEVH